MTPELIITCIVLYFSVLMGIAWYTGRKAGTSGYFLGNKASPWFAVAFGMIGDSLSGVTFISVPGNVGTAHFSYMQVVLGYFLGYFVIAYVLLPLYYRLNLTSIYTYLEQRFGHVSQKTGALFFMLSRLLGAAARLYLTASVIQYFVFDRLGVRFEVSVSIIIILILLYTYRGGIQTLVWTDTFQSLLLLSAVVFTIISISHSLGYSLTDMVTNITNSPYSGVWNNAFLEKNYWLKDILGGMFISITMTGLDQNMMQKNLSCPNLKDAQKNVVSFTFIMVLVNVFFVSLGALLYLYANSTGFTIPAKTDDLFPQLALNNLGLYTGIAFIIGLTASTFSSADSVLTTLTTSWYVDFMGLDKKQNVSDDRKTYTRHIIHVVFAALLLLVIILFKIFNRDAIITTVLTVATYTYGPLLGLFAFGILMRKPVNDILVPVVCLAAPALCYLIADNSAYLFNGYKFGYELLILNGLLTFGGLLLISRKAETHERI